MPDEYLELREESIKLLVLDNIPGIGHDLSRAAVNQAYQLIRNYISVEVVPVTVFGRTVFKKGAAFPSTEPQLNDVLVSIESANDGSRFANIMNFTGANGRNHSSVADEGVARIVIPTLKDIEKAVGDF